MRAYGADWLNQTPCCDDPDCDHSLIALEVECHPDETLVIYDKRLQVAVVWCRFCKRPYAVLGIADKTREIKARSNGTPQKASRLVHRHRSKRNEQNEP